MVFKKIKEKIISIIEKIKLRYYFYRVGRSMNTDMINYRPKKKEEEDETTRIQIKNK